MNLDLTKKMATQLAFGSFTIGTGLFLLAFALPDNGRLLTLGLLFVFFAAVLNGIYVLLLTYLFAITPQERQEIAIRVLLLLANIPVAALYIFIIMRFAMQSSF